MRKLAVLIGIIVIAAATHAAIIAKGGYGSPQALIAIGLAMGVAFGSVCVGVSWADRRYTLAGLMAVCLLAGEAFTMLTTAERVVAAREAAAEPVRQNTLARAAIQKRIDEAKAATKAETSPRVEAALASKARAEASVTSEAAKKGCAANCRALLNKAVDDAAAEIAAAREEVRAARKQAERELATAEAELVAKPAPQSETPLADKLGWQGWKLDLLAAALASLAVNGLGAALIAFGAHGHRKQGVSLRLADEAPAPVQVLDVQDAEVTAVPQRTASAARSRATAGKPPREKDHAAKFGVACLEPNAGAETPLAEIAQVYLRWCDRSGDTPLPPAEIGAAISQLFESAGLPVDNDNGRLVVRGVGIRDQHSIPVVPLLSASRASSSSKLNLRTA